ncbi:DUF4132 domain-containing protein [bacterium]|nr:DUF4132 domain-containing protein [bacterium]
MHKRVEFHEGTSNKFWEVEVSGIEVTTTWGRIGTAGQSKCKTYPNDEAALKDAESQFASKIKVGYQPVTAAVPPATQSGIQSTPEWLRKIRQKAYAWREWADELEPAVAGKWVRDLETWQAGLGVAVPSLRAAQREALAVLQDETTSDDPLVNAVALIIAKEGIDRVLGGGLSSVAQAMLRRNGLEVAQEADQHPPRYRWVVYRGQEPHPFIQNLDLTSWGKLRYLLARAPEPEYSQVVDWADRERHQGDLETQVMLAFLLPDQGWAEALVARCLQNRIQNWGMSMLPHFAFALVPSLRRADLVKQLCEATPYSAPQPDLAPSLLANLGSQAYPLIFKYLNGTQREQWTECLWDIPDPALAAQFKTILEERSLRQRLSEYFQKFPDLSIPALANVVVHGGKGKETARTLLAQILRQNPTWPALDNRELAVCQQILNRFPKNLQEAAPDQLPAVLMQPPWIGKRKGREPLVAKAREVPFAERIHWGGAKPKPYFYTVPPPKGMSDNTRYAEMKAEISRGVASPSDLDRLGDDRALQLWNEAPSRVWREPWGGLTPLLARFGLDAVVGFLRYSERLHSAIVELTRVEAPRVAPVMALGLAGQKSRKLARSWLQRFPRAALLGLIPAAVGTVGKGRDLAEDALRWMGTWLPRAEIEIIGDELAVSAALQEVLDFDPVQLVPAKLPKLPGYLDATALPRPVLVNHLALPLAATRHLLTMLSFSPMDPPYAGLEVVKAACTPESLEEFAWETYSLWHAAGGPARDKWAFQALAHLGGDESARRLAPLIRVWPQESLFARAEQGLDVLAVIGTDVALMHIYQMSEKLKSKALQEKARAKMDEIATRRGLTRDELADRLVPDLDLETDGGCPLDYGTRTFRVVFDEQLKPQLLGPDGKPLKDLPKGGAADPSDLVEKAIQRWKALKKDVKTLGQAQITRLELAMGLRRRWSGPAWELFLLRHPLLVHLVRRLLWGVYDDEKGLVSLFRVAEDSSLADSQDDAYKLPSDALVGLPHPLEMGPQALQSWGQLFADYAILQPFPQLGRPVFRLTEVEKEGTTLTRQEGRKVHPGKVVGLEARGWLRGEAWDGGVCCEMLRPMGPGQTAYLAIYDGLYLGAIHESGDQKLGDVQIKTGAHEALRLGSLDEIMMSELLRDLEGLQ